MIRIDFREWLLVLESKSGAQVALEILRGDQRLLSDIQGKLPTKTPTKLQGKLLPLAAYYYADMRVKNLDSLGRDIADYARLVNGSKMPVITVGDDLTVDDPHMSSHLGWSQVVHAKSHEDSARSAPPPQGDPSDQELVSDSEDGRVRVYRANSANACIILGQGERFCISQPGNTMFQSYRDEQTSTFYFVYDGTRTDDLAIVVVDVTATRGVLLTDRKNDTGKSIQDPFSEFPRRVSADPETYFRYLRELGVDTTVFRNESKTEEEMAEQRKLGARNHNKRWFVSLSPEEKSRYIGRGHSLTDEQFDFLWDNRLRALLTQYARLGSKASSRQVDRIASDPDLKKTYLRARLIAASQGDQSIWLTGKEYGLLSREQREKYLEPGENDRVAKSIVAGDLEAVKQLVHDDREMDRWNLTDGPMELAIESDNLEVVKYLYEDFIGDEMQEEYADYASMSASLDTFKYLLGRMPANTDKRSVMRSSATGAAIGGNLEVLRYLLEEEKVDSDVDILAIQACRQLKSGKPGHLQIIKYLVENRGATMLHQFLMESMHAQNLDALRYLIDEKQQRPSEFTAQEAIRQYMKKGLLDFVEYFVGEKGYRAPIEHIEETTPEIKDYLLSVDRERSLQSQRHAAGANPQPKTALPKPE